MLSDDLAHDRNLTREEALTLVDCDLDVLLRAAARRRDAAHGSIISYSRKVFIPLTKLCRDVCHYCTFAQRPRKNERAYLSLDEVLAIARAGHTAGCKEALFTLGDQPERRYRTAADELGSPRTSDDLVLPRRGGRRGARANRTIAAPQSGPFDAARCGRLARRLTVPGAHARVRIRAAVRARRPAPWLTG